MEYQNSSNSDEQKRLTEEQDSWNNQESEHSTPPKQESREKQDPTIGGELEQREPLPESVIDDQQTYNETVMKVNNEQTNNSMDRNKQQLNKRPSEENQSSKKTKPWLGFLKLLAAAILGSVLTLGAVTQLDLFHTQPDTSPKVENHEEQHVDEASTSAQPVANSDSVADIVEQVSDSIVGIVNKTEQSQNPFMQDSEEVKKGVGSGVIFDVTDEEAFIVTNNHVIEGASSIEVSLADGKTVDGKLIGADSLTDIAVVKIKGDYDVKPIEFGDSDSLRSGDQVIAIGNPLGLDLSRTVTQGIVSAIDRSIPVQTSAGEWNFDVIQTDAAINPGNSGGALLNNQGALVGINSLKIGGSGVEGLGFAIPSNEVNQLIGEIKESGKIIRPYVGVGLRSVSEIPPYYLQDLPDEVKEGAVVLSVDDQSAASKAGIKVEDVIVSIDGEKVTSDNDFRSYLYKNLSIDDKVTIEFYRGGELKKVELTLTSNKNV